MADKDKFIKPELKTYSAKKLLTQDRLMNAMNGIREIQTQLWKTMPDDQYEKLEPEFDTAIAAMMERIGKYIGVCTAQEMQNIDIGLMISIGLGDGGATKDKTVVADQKEEKKTEEKKTETKVQMETNEELIKTRTERDIFKKLYEQMTERLLERRE